MPVLSPLCIVRRGFADGWNLVYTIYVCPDDDSDEWIEYIPEPVKTKQKHVATCRHGNELQDCDACDGGNRDR